MKSTQRIPKRQWLDCSSTSLNFFIWFSNSKPMKVFLLVTLVRSHSYSINAFSHNNFFLMLKNTSCIFGEDHYFVHSSQIFSANHSTFRLIFYIWFWHFFHEILSSLSQKWLNFIQLIGTGKDDSFLSCKSLFLTSKPASLLS